MRCKEGHVPLVIQSLTSAEGGLGPRSDQKEMESRKSQTVPKRGKPLFAR